ncbi:MAG: hypothetical protein H6839_15855 [Planctomycetes bacterium]|nr:hypothetical protein [Planctomycetota bacterium]
MSLTLQFAGATQGTPAGLTVTRIGTTPDVEETWLIELDAEAATAAALEPVVQALKDLQGTSGDLKLQSDGMDLRALGTADCRSGPTLVGVTEQDRAPGQAENRRRVRLEFRATLQDAASAIQSHRYSVRLTTEPGQPQRVLTTGAAILRKGEAPADSEAVLLPVLAAGYRRVRQTVMRDAQVPSVEYEVMDEQVFRALPGGVDDGHYIISEFTDAQARSLRAISGFFTGASARARALELRPGAPVSSRVSENPFSRRVDFEFIELVESGGTLALTESLTFTTTRRVIDHPLLDTALPAYRQQIGAPQTEVIQEGSAVGDGRHVSPPAPRYAGDLIERQVHYSMPHAGLPADRRWVTTWRYVSRGRSAILAGAPHA